MFNNNRVISSLIYKYLELIGSQGVSFVVSIVLARLLAPDDYGIIAVMTIFVSIAQVFVQGGLNTALIQNKEVDEEDYSTVFYLSMGMAILLYGILYSFTPFIESFFNIKGVETPFRVLALVLFPGAFNSIQNAKIARELQFKKMFYSGFMGMIISGTVGIYMAYNGYGVWALVTQQLIERVSRTILTFYFVRWYPKVHFSKGRIKVLFSFGWKVLAARLVHVLYQELRSIVIGKKYNTSMLAYYNRGQQFPKTITNSINSAIESVMLPVLSSEQGEIIRIESMMSRFINMSTFVIFPMMAGLAAVSKPLIQVLLTEKWVFSVPFVIVNCFIFALYPVASVTVQAMNAIGRSDLVLKLEIIKKSVGILMVAVVVIYWDSVMLIAMTGIVTSLFEILINVYVIRDIVGYSYLKLMKDIAPSAMLSLIMMVIVFSIQLINLNMKLTLILQVITGMVVYIGLSWLFKIEPFMYLLKIIRLIVNKNRKINN